MTDSQQNPHDTSTTKDVEDLARGLDGSNAQQAKAIAAFVDGRIAVAIKDVNDKVDELLTTQRDTVQKAAALPPAQRAAVTGQVNEAAQEVRATKAEADDLAERQANGEHIEPEEVSKTEARADQASDKVEQAKTVVEEQASQPAASSSRKGTKTVEQRLTDVESTVSRHTGEVDQLKQGLSDVTKTANRALSVALNSATSDNAIRRGSAWAVGVFGLVFLLYLVIWGISGSLEHTWRDQFAWPFGLAAVAFWLGVFTAKNESNQSHDSGHGRFEHDDHDSHDDQSADSGIGRLQFRQSEREQSSHASSRS
ncbi:MAG: hypothetical protein V4678_02745 [Patescibacteria group bacterium]